MYLLIFYSGATTNTTETEMTKQHPAEGNNHIYKEGPSGTYTCQPSVPCCLKSAKSTQKPQSDLDVKV